MVVISIKTLKNGKVPAAATTAMQGDMFRIRSTIPRCAILSPIECRTLSANNRERSLYNTLAKSGVPMFPFGSGAGGNVDGYGMMLHRALKPYEDMVSRGENRLWH